MLERREILLFCVAAPVLWSDLALARSAPIFPNTVIGLRRAVAVEMSAHYRYVQFSRRAYEDGYKGIAYMFTALATSELIHAQNYDRILALMGASIDEHTASVQNISDTKENLIAAANAEINTIKNIYPKILEDIQLESHSEAEATVTYAWKSHKQHRDIIKKIRKWSPDYFETVAKRIDEETDRYFVCQICGSTLYKVPDEECPICEYQSTHYRLIDERAFL